MATPSTSTTPPPAGGTGPSPSSAPSSADAPFEFPREYWFPPFFTRQTNLTTYHAQREKWASLVLAYCAHRRLFRLSAAGAAHDDLFHNRRLGRRLAPADARDVLEHLRREGRAEPVAPGGDLADDAWVYWKTPDEWARDLEAWVDDTAQKGTVLTLYELTEGEDTRGAPFHGLDPELLQKALQVLVKRGKAQIFGTEDSQGVKFF